MVLSQKHGEGKCHLVEDGKDLQKNFDVVGSQLLKSVLSVYMHCGKHIPV
jgi:hypothetical protein